MAANPDGTGPGPDGVARNEKRTTKIKKIKPRTGLIRCLAVTTISAKSKTNHNMLWLNR
jgi:CRISPR/Cas system-associated protein endoribonuclease Cas2